MAVKQSSYSFQYATFSLRDDEDFVKSILSEEKGVFEHASERLRHNIDIFKLAFDENNTGNFQYTSEAIRGHREFVQIAIEGWGSLLQYADPVMRADEDIVLQAVFKSGDALQYASAALRSKKDVVITAVNSTAYALDFASAELRDDEEVVLAALKQDKSAFRYASPRLRMNKDFIGKLLDAGMDIFGA